MPQIRRRAVISALLGDDHRLAAQTGSNWAAVLFPDGTGSDAEWWPTPLGQAVAGNVGCPGAEAVSCSVADAMLGCSKQ